MSEPRYIVWVNTRQFYLCDTLVDALGRKRDFGGLIYEPMALDCAEKLALKDALADLVAATESHAAEYPSLKLPIANAKEALGE